MSHEDLLRRYEDGVNAVENAVRGISKEELDRAPQPGKWSIRQLVAHVADADLVLAVRMRFVAAEPGSPLKGFDQDKWANGLGYAQLPIEQSLALLRAVRQQTATMLHTLPDSAWNQVGRHDERGELTLVKLLQDTVDHAEHHAERIHQLRRELGQ